MNIAIDIRSLQTPYRTGVGEYVAELLTALFAHDKTNQYFLYGNAHQDFSRHLPLWTQANVHTVITHWPNKFLTSTLAACGRPYLDRIIRKKRHQNVDIFFSPHINFTAVSPQIPHVLTIHDISFEHFPQYFSLKQRVWHGLVRPRQQAERAACIITPSEATRQDVIDTYGVSPQKVVCIPSGVPRVMDRVIAEEDIRRVRDVYGLTQKYILFLGTVEPRKNIESVIKAFAASSWMQKQGYTLVIAGSRGWKEQGIMDCISNTKNVRYIGYVDAADKPALYALADVFVYPSWFEGFGFPILEAMAAGTPVITSNRSAMVEVAEDGAYLVSPYNTEQLRCAMERVLQSPTLSALYKARGKERVQRYSWHVAAERMVGVWSSVLERSSTERKI